MAWEYIEEYGQWFDSETGDWSETDPTASAPNPSAGGAWGSPSQYYGNPSTPVVGFTPQPVFNPNEPMGPAGQYTSIPFVPPAGTPTNEGPSQTGLPQSTFNTGAGPGQVPQSAANQQALSNMYSADLRNANDARRRMDSLGGGSSVSSYGGGSSGASSAISQMLQAAQQAQARAVQAQQAGITDPNIMTAYQQGSLSLEQARLAQQQSQFNATMAFNQQNAAGSPIDWARFNQTQGQIDFGQWLQTQNLGQAQSEQELRATLGFGNLSLAQQEMALREWQAQQQAGFQSAQLAQSGYQISNNVDIARMQVALAQQLGQGDQAQGWARLALLSEAQDISNYVSQAQIDQAYQRLALDAQSIGMDNAIKQQRMALDARLGELQAQSAGAQAQASMAHAAAAASQAQAALRGVEVQLQLGNGNIQLGYAELENARTLGLAEIQVRREELGEKVKLETADLKLRQYLGMAGIQAQMAGISADIYRTDVGAASQRYSTDVGAQTDIYRSELDSATRREATAAAARQAELELAAELSGGPRDWLRYAKFLRGVNPQGVANGFAALSDGQELAGFQAPTGNPEARSLETVLQDTGIARPTSMIGSFQFPTRPGPVAYPTVNPVGDTNWGAPFTGLGPPPTMPEAGAPAPPVFQAPGAPPAPSPAPAPGAVPGQGVPDPPPVSSSSGALPMPGGGTGAPPTVLPPGSVPQPTAAAPPTMQSDMRNVPRPPVPGGTVADFFAAYQQWLGSQGQPATSGGAPPAGMTYTPTPFTGFRPPSAPQPTVTPDTRFANYQPYQVQPYVPAQAGGGFVAPGAVGGTPAGPAGLPPGTTIQSQASPGLLSNEPAPAPYTPPPAALAGTNPFAGQSFPTNAVDAGPNGTSGGYFEPDESGSLVFRRYVRPLPAGLSWQQQNRPDGQAEWVVVGALTNDMPGGTYMDAAARAAFDSATAQNTAYTQGYANMMQNQAYANTMAYNAGMAQDAANAAAQYRQAQDTARLYTMQGSADAISYGQPALPVTNQGFSAPGSFSPQQQAAAAAQAAQARGTVSSSGARTPMAGGGSASTYIPPGEAAGGAGGFPQFATGTDYVPRTGLALVHQGEAVIPADQNPHNPLNQRQPQQQPGFVAPGASATDLNGMVEPKVPSSVAGALGGAMGATAGPTLPAGYHGEIPQHAMPTTTAIAVESSSQQVADDPVSAWIKANLDPETAAQMLANVASNPGAWSVQRLEQMFGTPGMPSDPNAPPPVDPNAPPPVDPNADLWAELEAQIVGLGAGAQQFLDRLNQIRSGLLSIDEIDQLIDDIGAWSFANNPPFVPPGGEPPPADPVAAWLATDPYAVWARANGFGQQFLDLYAQANMPNYPAALRPPPVTAPPATDPNKPPEVPFVPPSTNPAPQPTTPYNPDAGAYQPPTYPPATGGTAPATPGAGSGPSGDEELRRVFGFVPVSPHQIPYRIWHKLLPAEKDMVLAVFHDRGWYTPDTQELIDRTKPGNIAYGRGQYAAVGR